MVKEIKIKFLENEGGVEATAYDENGEALTRISYENTSGLKTAELMLIAHTKILNSLEDKKLC